MKINRRKPLMIVWADYSWPTCRRKSKTSHGPRLPEQQEIKWFMPRSAWKHWCTGPVLGSSITAERQDNHYHSLSCAKKPSLLSHFSSFHGSHAFDQKLYDSRYWFMRDRLRLPRWEHKKLILCWSKLICDLPSKRYKTIYFGLQWWRKEGE